MALRFRKSIKLAPGVRWNLSGTGSSWTFGPRGASVGVGKRGTFLNTGIPSTGLSSRGKLSGGSETKSRQSSGATTSVSMTCGIRDDGTLYFQDPSGAAMPEHLVEVAKKQNKEAILGLIQRKCDEINEQVELLGRLHYDTPDPRIKPKFVPRAYGEAEPTVPRPRKLGILDKLFSSRRLRVEAANNADVENYRDAASKWQRANAEFAAQMAGRKSLVETLIYQDVGAMESFLEESLQDITWPRETQVALDIQDDGERVMLDVDLPELEDMPTKLAAVPARGLKLSVKDLTATKVQRLYAEHVHGILFRLIGEVFAALPKAQTVVASGYSQRRDPATAQLRDDYLLSVRVQRSNWEANDFAHLAAIDVIEALARYDLRREMLKSGLLKAITPHSS
ncbi:DUF4236 domain-containing protein [Rhizobacter sp. P5_C2]